MSVRRELCVLALVGALGCSAPGQTIEESPDPDAGARSTAALATSRGIARHDPVLDALLAPGSAGWQLDGDALASPGFRQPTGAALGARLPLDAAGELTIGVARDSRRRLSLRLVGVRSNREVQIDAGRATWADVLPSTDLVVAASEHRVEQLLLLRDERAPRRFRWSLGLGSELSVRSKGSEGVLLADGRGEVVLRIAPPYALDQRGRRRDAVWALNEGEFRVELDTRDLEFPILLDPAVESYVWQQVAASVPGLAGRDAPLAFDSRPGRNVTVLFSGHQGGAATPPDTWEWDGTNWVKRCDAATCGVGGRFGHALAFHDGTAKGTLLFGGWSGVALGDTWLWDGTGWNELCTTCTVAAAPFRPASRRSHGMAYHAGYGTVVFGGTDGSTTFDDTWVWNGVSWTQKCTACVTGVTKPSARSGHAMAYDAAHGKTVLFGGGSSSETWLWDATTETWSPACTTCQAGSTKPNARNDFGMAYDSRRGKVVLVGGCCDAGAQRWNDTWEWDGSTWKQVALLSDGRDRMGLTFDGNRGRVVMYGGAKNFGGGLPEDVTFEYHARGGGCSLGAECDTGYCVDGVCCESPSCAVCSSCDQAAGPGFCNPIVSAEDPSGCSGASQCDSASVCKLKNGQSCNGAGQCASGNCVDGTCCISTCTTPCRTCANASGTCTSLVTAQDDDTCSGTNTCSSAGTCGKKNGQSCGLGSECASGHCVDGTCCGDACTTPCRSCANASGACTSVIANQDDNACNGVNTCDSLGDCKKKTGQGCGAATECASGHCSDGFCCSSACSEGCDVCSASGTCTVLGAGQTGQCGAYKCGGSAACPTTCTTDTQCVAGNYCGGNACLPQKNKGQTCGASNECQSGNCADGVCCDTACTGKCMACAAANKEDSNPANSGTCGAAKQGTNPGGACKLATDPCGEQDSCSGSPGTCNLAPSGKSCGPTTCSNGAVSGKICNGSGTCVDQTNAQCAPYVCKGSACSSPCGADTDCQSDHYCAGGVCVAKSNNGAACSAANVCKSGFCVDGLCCDSPCTGQCQACAEVGSYGQCKVVSGEPRASRPPCTGAAGDSCKGVCDGANPTACTYPASGTACKNASCTGDVAQPAGACDGAGLCAVPATQNCAPYTCNAQALACATTCASDTDCAQGAICNTSTGKCAAASATCKDTTTVQLPNGQTEACIPYRCVGGACQQQCSSGSDCAPGYDCQGNACVLHEAGADSGSGGAGTGGADAGPAKKNGGASDDGGCGCRVPQRSPASDSAGWLAVGVLAWLRRRRGTLPTTTPRTLV